MTEDRRCRRCEEPVPADAPEGLCPGCLLRAGLEDAQPPDAASRRPFSPEEMGRLIPHLEVKEIIGQGGMGVVYRARQASLDREVALKVLPRHVAADPAFAERFHREAKAMARLSHPNIVAVYEAGEVDGTYYLVMELVGGVNLRQAQATGRLSPAEALAVVPQICDALQYAHDRGVVHRDVKPENILLDRHGVVKITDFGLVKLVGRSGGDPTLTGTDQVMGTWHYMAPEQMQTPQDVDHRADIYSLGVVFYELLTGELPMGRFLPPSEKSKVDAAVDAVVMRALERERDRRWQRVDEVKTGVEAASRGESDAAPDSVLPTPPRLREEPVRTRTSKLAVFGCLASPIAILLALGGAALAGAAGSTPVSVILPTAALLVLGGVVVSIVALARIGSDPGLTGTGFAVTGIVLPVVLVVLAVPVMFMVRADEPGPHPEFMYEGVPVRMDGGAPTVAPLVAPAVARMSEADHASLVRLLRRLDDIPKGMTDIEAVANLIDPARRAWFLNLDAAEFKRLHDQERLGLAMIDTVSSRIDLAHPLIHEARLPAGDGSGTVTLAGGGHRIRFPVVRIDGEWYLAIGDVLRFVEED